MLFQKAEPQCQPFSPYLSFSTNAWLTSPLDGRQLEKKDTWADRLQGGSHDPHLMRFTHVCYAISLSTGKAIACSKWIPQRGHDAFHCYILLCQTVFSQTYSRYCVCPSWAFKKQAAGNPSHTKIEWNQRPCEKGSSCLPGPAPIEIYLRFSIM